MGTDTPGGKPTELVDLGQIGLPRLVFALLRERFSGAVTLPQAQPEAGERTIWFQGGMPIFTDWVSPADRLGQILVETGQLTKDERDRAVGLIAQPVPGAVHERLGHFLIRRRLILTAQLRKTLRIQCARKLVHCFALRGGSARVNPDTAAPADDQTLGAQVNALELIFLGVSAHYDLPRIAAEMGPLLAAPLRPRSSLERYRGLFHFSADDEALLAAFTPSATINEAAERSGQSQLRAAQIAYTLWACQMLKAAEVGAREVPTGAHAVPPELLAGPARKVSIGAGTTDPARLADFTAQLERLEAAVAAGAHAFELMGVPIDAGKPQVRAAWHTLSRRFHPDALAHHELGHLRERSATVFASLNEAYQLLNDPRQREELAGLLRAGGRPDPDPRTATPSAQAILATEVLVREGDILLRAGNFERALDRFTRAAALCPGEAELQAAVVWCEYQSSPDREAAREPTHAALRAALSQQPRCARAHYYLGLLHLQTGEDESALAAFTLALEIEPEMLDAKRQLHAIELRRNSPPEQPRPFGRR
jgi:tetratricopeptide (TPR) repeat protein